MPSGSINADFCWGFFAFSVFHRCYYSPPGYHERVNQSFIICQFFFIFFSIVFGPTVIITERPPCWETSIDMAILQKAINMTNKSAVSSIRPDVRWLRSWRSRPTSAAFHVRPECINGREKKKKTIKAKSLPKLMVCFWGWNPPRQWHHFLFPRCRLVMASSLLLSASSAFLLSSFSSLYRHLGICSRWPPPSLALLFLRVFSGSYVGVGALDTRTLGMLKPGRTLLLLSTMCMGSRLVLRSSRALLYGSKPKLELRFRGNRLCVWRLARRSPECLGTSVTREFWKSLMWLSTLSGSTVRSSLARCWRMISGTA